MNGPRLSPGPQLHDSAPQAERCSLTLTPGDPIAESTGITAENALIQPS